MEIINFLFGALVLYAFIHLWILQKKSYELRTTYEKVVTYIALVGIALIFIGVMSSN
jgi:uncharacterized membrane protein YiaA